MRYCNSCGRPAGGATAPRAGIAVDAPPQLAATPEIAPAAVRRPPWGLRWLGLGALLPFVGYFATLPAHSLMTAEHGESLRSDATLAIFGALGMFALAIQMLRKRDADRMLRAWYKPVVVGLVLGLFLAQSFIDLTAKMSSATLLDGQPPEAGRMTGMVFGVLVVAHLGVGLVSVLSKDPRRRFMGGGAATLIGFGLAGIMLATWTLVHAEPLQAAAELRAQRNTPGLGFLAVLVATVAAAGMRRVLATRASRAR